MENTLFNQHRMDKYAKDKSFKFNLSHHDLIREHIEKLEKGELKAEKSNYLYFFDVFLRDILGYDRKENVLFEAPMDKGPKRSEFILTEGDKKFMIVELKGQNVDLDKPQNGHNNQTPVEQAREYSLKTKSANWIMVSNYDEFRLYHWEKKDDYISFKAEELLDKDKFKYFMLAFSKKSHLRENYTDKLLKKSLVIEKDIEADFYKLFHETRLMLIKELEDINGFETPKAVHYAQAILNRYMFICFAEDINNLLPSEISTETIYVPIKERNISERTIWNRLNELFGFINKGNEYKGINGYNGVLFKEDFNFITIRDIVEDPKYFKEQRQKWDLKEYSLKITELMGPYGKKINPIYWNLLTISSINFESDLDVNILGHIFENSIGDLEELREGSKGKRKKDGIFYTPNYITEYICKNTIITYLSKSGKSKEIKDLIAEYWGSEIHELDEKLKKIRIVDPACGSGAFLNKAVDVLLEIHEEIHKTLAKFFDNVSKRRAILKNNIYGVDLNEESIEITKLALFLKVAQRDSKLPDLDKNIKCGNSLIADPEYVGKKAFNWEIEFPEIFEQGGFDIVIGNPPYIRNTELNQRDKEYFNDNYGSAYKQYDILILFFELGAKILNNKGYLGFITSNKFLASDYGDKLRDLILKTNKIISFIDISNLRIFKDASTYPVISILKKENNDLERENNNVIFKTVKKIEDLNGNTNIKTVKQLHFSEGEDNKFLEEKEGPQFEIINKLNNDGIKVKELFQCKRGSPKNKIEISNNETGSLECIIAKAIDRYYYKKSKDTFVISELQDDILQKEKILLPRTVLDLKAAYDAGGSFIMDRIYYLIPKDQNINLKLVTLLLNSKLLDFYYKSNFGTTHIGGGYLDLRGTQILELPLKLDSEKKFNEKEELMFKLNKDLHEEINSFHTWLHRTFNIEKLSKNLEKYYELTFEEFLKEVKKKKVDIKPRKTQELLENEFNESLAVIKPLLHEIEVTDREIDEMVYDLYGLTLEERDIVENKLN